MGIVIKMRERRGQARIQVNMVCSLVIGEIHYSGVTGNVSLSGVYIQSLTPTLSKERISERGELRLYLGTASITSTCRIVFIGGDTTPHLEGVGVAFERIQKQDARRLEEFISTLRKD